MLSEEKGLKSEWPNIWTFASVRRGPDGGDNKCGTTTISDGLLIIERFSHNLKWNQKKHRPLLDPTPLGGVQGGEVAPGSGHGGRHGWGRWCRPQRRALGSLAPRRKTTVASFWLKKNIMFPFLAFKKQWFFFRVLSARILRNQKNDHSFLKLKRKSEMDLGQRVGWGRCPVALWAKKSRGTSPFLNVKNKKW